VAGSKGKSGESGRRTCPGHDFADAAEGALRAGQNKIDRLFDKVRIREIGQDELDLAGFSPAIFRNLNTPEELEAEQRPILRRNIND